MTSGLIITTSIVVFKAILIFILTSQHSTVCKRGSVLKRSALRFLTGNVLCIQSMELHKKGAVTRKRSDFKIASLGTPNCGMVRNILWGEQNPILFTLRTAVSNTYFFLLELLLLFLFYYPVKHRANSILDFIDCDVSKWTFYGGWAVRTYDRRAL